METHERSAYPSDYEWAFVAPYLTLMDEAGPQRRRELREVFDGSSRTAACNGA